MNAEQSRDPGQPKEIAVVPPTREALTAGRSIMGSMLGIGSKSVDTGFTETTAAQTPGALIDPARQAAFREQLADIDRAQVPGPDGRTR